MPDSQIEELFSQTLCNGYDDDDPWNAVCQLRNIGTREVFDQATAWTQSLQPLMRARGVDVLAQLGQTVDRPHSFPIEAFRIVSSMMELETEDQPLASGIHALGHLDNSDAIPIIERFVSHENCNVRFAVACSLGSYANDERTAKHLLSLFADEDDDVRDWAVFGLGCLGDIDTPQIRCALLAMMDDPFADVRMEAACGLGKRRDSRIAPLLIEVFQNPPVAMGYLEAACDLLGFEREPEDWECRDYVAALRKLV